MHQQHGTGAVRSKWDPRDFKYKPSIARGAFDWKAGYDIEAKLGKNLITKDQNGSGSCGGQAWAYYMEVLEAIATENYEPRSARYIYSHTHERNGGSAGRTNSAFVKDKGSVREVLAPSYENGEPPSEEFMQQVPELSKEAIEEAEVNRALSYLSFRANIETVASAIRDNYGCIIMIGGQNNGTWRSEFPKPPKGQYEWLHWLYCGKAKLINGKKFIGTKQSWGDDTGKDGWQWISEDYFKAGFIYEGWTLAWDFKPPMRKTLLIQAFALVKQLLALLTTKK